jgi:hypothetical protein
MIKRMPEMNVNLRGYIIGRECGTWWKPNRERDWTWKIHQNTYFIFAQSQNITIMRFRHHADDRKPRWLRNNKYAPVCNRRKEETEVLCSLSLILSFQQFSQPHDCIMNCNDLKSRRRRRVCACLQKFRALRKQLNWPNDFAWKWRLKFPEDNHHCKRPKFSLEADLRVFATRPAI